MWCLYIDHSLGYRLNYSIFYQLPSSNLFTHRVLFSLEKPLVKSRAPGSILYHICFPTYYMPLLFSDLLFQKPKNTLLHFFVTYFISRLFEIYLSNLWQILSHELDNFWAVSRKRDWQPLFRIVCKCLLVCAGAYIGDLLVLPTGLISWFLTEGNTYLYFAASLFSLQG